jgi:hypothetical protein
MMPDSTFAWLATVSLLKRCISFMRSRFPFREIVPQGRIECSLSYR